MSLRGRVLSQIHLNKLQDGLFSAGQNMSGPVSMLWEEGDGSSGQSLVVIKKKKNPRQDQQEAAEATEGEFSCFRPQRSCCMKCLNGPGCMD